MDKTKTSTVAEVQAAKRKLQEDIKALLGQFQADTGLPVSSVTASYGPAEQIMRLRIPDFYAVFVEVKL